MTRNHDHAHGSHHHHRSDAVRPSTGAKYFCPMCPGVESDQPGDCPKCGMALERNPAWKPTDFQSTTAGGVTGAIAGRKVLVGKPAFLRENRIGDVDALKALAVSRQAEGATAIFAAIDGRVAGVLIVADPVKATTPGALAELRELGVKVIMLTGDNPRTAEAIARQLGIGDFQAGVTPQDKHDHR